MTEATRTDAEFHATRMADLDALAAFVTHACTRAGAGTDICFAVRLASEEIFTNIFKHGYGGGEGPVAVRVAATGHGVRIEFRDHAAPFDPTRVTEPDIHAHPETREVGNLGLHLVRKTMDAVTYERDAGGSNILVLTKDFPANDARD